MSKVQPRTLSGFMELLPPQQAQFERMAAILRETYSLYGFTPLDTPLIESSEVLLAKGGGETEKQIYRFMKGDTDLSLRFDLTVPLAKYVAQNYGQLTFPFRRFQIGKVYRGERAQRGRFREFYQADIDVIGDGKLDISNEAEIPAIIYQAFSKMGLRRFQIRVNNRKILNGFYAMLGLTDKSGDIMRTVDKLDKIGGEKVAALLTGEDIDHSDRRENFQNTIFRLLELGALPIINENDTVATAEIKVGDNDTLGAVVACTVKADLLVLLSDIQGLYTADPRKDPGARLIPVVEEITADIEALAGGAGSGLGTGGMATKLRAARMVTGQGCDMIITNGDQPQLLYDIVEGKQVGTRFLGRRA